jgi:hypothetical protein
MPFPTIVAAAALMASAAIFVCIPAAEASQKKKPSGSSYSSGSNYSGHSGRSSSRNIGAGIGAAVIGYGLTGGIQEAV